MAANQANYSIAGDPNAVWESYANCRFYVQIGGVAQAVFTEISGLQVEVEVTDYEEGGQNDFAHRLPGRMKISNLTLKRGMTASNELLKWCLNVSGASGPPSPKVPPAPSAKSGGTGKSQLDRRNVTVTMVNSLGKSVLNWTFANAYPVKWIGPQFVADGTAAAVETLELAHSGMNLTAPE